MGAGNATLGILPALDSNQHPFLQELETSRRSKCRTDSCQYTTVPDGSSKFEANREYHAYRLSIEGPSGNFSKDCYDTKDAYILQLKDNLTMEEVANLNRPIVLATYSARYAEIIKNGVDKVKAELRFKSKYVKRTDDVLNKIKKQLKMQNENVTFVGMHYRGTDYNIYLNKTYKSYKPPPDHNYYWNAMSYFMKHYINVIFVLISVDKEWLKTNVPYLNKTAHLVVNPTNSKPVEDLALLSYCNHSIISYGTFGSAAALYSEGTTFVYNLGLPLDQRGATVAMGIAQILPSWHIRD
ncbi:hypothetical protein RI129_011106 [Pyrocoelia pectoralis]|uniref:L-Fucosyltransferase n=1 Tax=Pyrocoelia pectoralis TaxID=417401 RepID=A0AAN7ZA96_9COLE